MHQTRQLAKHRGAVLRIVMRHHFANRLVVRQHPRWWRFDAVVNRLAVDANSVTKLDALTDVGRLVIDRDPPL